MSRSGGQGSSGSGAARVVSGGNLGAAYTLALGGDKDVWLVGTLNANTVLTLSGLTSGAHARLLLDQDATGGRTLTLSDGTNTQLVAIPTTAGAPVAVDVSSPDGSTLYVDVAGGLGPAGPVGPASTVPGPTGPPGPGGPAALTIVGRGTTNFNVAHNTNVVIPFTAEIRDDLAGHDNATNNTRVAVDRTGIFRMALNVRYAAPASATGSMRAAAIFKNGDPALNRLAGARGSHPTTSTQVIDLSVAWEGPLNSGDYVEVRAYQDSGAALDIIADAGSPVLAVSYVGV